MNTLDGLPLFEAPKPARKPVRDVAWAVARTDRAVAAAASVTDPRWLELVRRAVLYLARRGGHFNADDVWDEVDALVAAAEPPVEVPRDRQAGGQVFRSLAREGWIVDTMTVVRSERPGAHRKKLTVWVGRVPA